MADEKKLEKKLCDVLGRAKTNPSLLAAISIEGSSSPARTMGDLIPHTDYSVIEDSNASIFSAVSRSTS